MSEGRIDRVTVEKERGLLDQDYAEPCPNCGGVVFEWWNSDTCQDCAASDDETTEQTKLVTDGGQDLKSPAEKRLAGETEVTFQCGVAASNQFDPSDPEYCGHEPETIELDEPASVDENNRIHVPGRPVECSECGQPVEFEFNGVRVMFA